MSGNPEIGTRIQTGGVLTNYHDRGEGEAVLLIHGSGPGVSAWANWRTLLENPSPNFRYLAPDMAGFGYSKIQPNYTFSRQAWLDQLIAFLDSHNIKRAHVIGNSFGGSMALAMAISAPHRVERLVLMGSVGVEFAITEGLDTVWGYTPSMENMRQIMGYFAYNQDLISDALIHLRYEASIRQGVQENYAKMFPAPRQRWVKGMSHDESEIRAIKHKTLLVHGRDDKVIPLQTSLTLNQWISDSELHIFGQCGHWTQIEKVNKFQQLIENFLVS